MRSSKCPRCGHVNFSAAVACKRCGNDLSRPGTGGGVAPANPQAGAAPHKSFGTQLAILGVVLSLAGVYLLMSGSASPYYLVVGIGIAASGVLVAAGKRAGLYVYFATFAMMLVWSLVEIGADVSKIVIRLGLSVLIGIYLLSDKVRAGLK